MEWCTAPGLWANSINVDFTLSLEGSDFADQVMLIGATVGGDLLLDDLDLTKVPPLGPDDPMLTLYGAQIGGTCFMRRIQVPGSRASEAHIGGVLLGPSAKLGRRAVFGGEHPLETGLVLDARKTRIGGDVRLGSLTTSGEVSFVSCQIGHLGPAQSEA